MPRQIPETCIQEIEKLLQSGTTFRQVAIQTNVNRKTVARIADSLGVTSRKAKTMPTLSPNMQRPPQRCTSCGGMVHMPCLRCRIVSLDDEKGARHMKHKKEVA